MKSVADLVEPKALQKLASPSNFRLGQEIAKNGQVSFTLFSPQEVMANVEGTVADHRIVGLESTHEGLAWHCSCTLNQKLFCKHLVATALTTWEQSPEHTKA